MKKKISLLVATVLLALFGSCSHESTINFTINGQLDDSDFEGAMVYLSPMDEGPIDSAVISGGVFHFKGAIPAETIGVINTTRSESGMQYRSIVVLENGKISINLRTDELSGTPLNDQLYKSWVSDSVSNQLKVQLDSVLSGYYNAETEADRNAAEQAYDKLDSCYKARRLSIAHDLYNKNKDNILGAFSMYQIVQVEEIAYDSLESILAHVSPVVNEFNPLRKLRTQLFHVANTSEGKYYADVEGIDFATGKMTTLKEMIDTNKVTLIDFWASWCGPCRQEISENLVRLYNEYKDKGLNIIGIDVWDKMPNHKEAVEKLGIEYPQLIDTTRVATENYGVEGIPTILLIDRNGIIVRRNIRGEEIEAAVLQLLEDEK